MQKYYGDLGAASIRFGLKCKYANEQTRIAIVRIKHRIHRFVTSVLPMESVVRRQASISLCGELSVLLMEFGFQLGEHIVKFRIVYNGATIMHCNQFIVEYQKKYMDEHVGNILSANQRNILAKNLMEISTVKV